MTRLKTTYILSGTILSLGMLAHPADYAISGTVFATAGASESTRRTPAATGPPQILMLRTPKPMTPLLQTLPATGLKQQGAISGRTVLRCNTTPERPSLMSVQRALSRLGYDPGPINGLMGARTRGAIAAYEEENGWASSGSVSSRLYDCLVADMFPKSHALTGAGQDGHHTAILASVRPQTMTNTSTNASDATSRPTVAFAPRTALGGARHPPLKSTGQLSRLEFAIADFVNVLRATSQFALRLFAGPKQPDPESMPVSRSADTQVDK